MPRAYRVRRRRGDGSTLEEVVTVKRNLLAVCLPLCGLVACVGGRTAVEGRDAPNDGSEKDAGPDASGAVTVGSASNSGAQPQGTSSDGTTRDTDLDAGPRTFTDPDWGMLAGDGGIAVGDHVDDEVVVGVRTEEYCTTIELEGPAPFSCSETQLATLEAGGAGASEPLLPEINIELEATGCDALVDLQRQLLLENESAKLERMYLSQLGGHCLPAKREVHVYGGEQVDICPADRNYDSGVPYTPDSEEGATDYSTTNTQVVGVDEADYIKNDGNTIYALTGTSLVVFDAWPVEELSEVARVALPAEPRRMFLAEDRLVVYLRVSGAATEDTCTYGYDCRSSSETGSTLVQVYDVSDPTTPELLKEYEFSGSYIGARRIGDAVFSVLHDQGAKAPASANFGVSGATPDELDRDYAQQNNALAKVINGLPAEHFLPRVTERQPGGPETTYGACNVALATSASRGTSFVSVVGFDLTALGAPSSTLIASKPGFVYASPESLYLAVDGVDGKDDSFSWPRVYQDVEDDKSTIHKFTLDGIGVDYHGSQGIPGHVLNQFSMDEHDGVLRVATSSGWVPSPDVSSNIVTLGEKNDEFTVLGELRGLAPKEDIRSVRFDGERGFVVTFKKTDPLFAIGLSDPSEPEVLGELKIPGFSTYMHLLDDDHLLTVGFDADDQGDFAFFDGIQVQIFDVSDLSDPKLQHKAVIGTRGSGSEALLNHLAFNYFPSRNVLALPATICAGGDNGAFGDVFEFAGLVVFDISLEDGITERGRLPFATPDAVDAGVSLDCGRWWTNASSLVKRSIFLEDYAIGVSDEWLKAAALDDLGTVLRSAPLGE